MYSLSNNKNKGFTLFELMVVLAIMGLVIGLTTVAIGRTGRIQVRAAADQIASALELTRDYAVNQGKPQQLEINVKTFKVKSAIADKWQDLPDNIEYKVHTAKNQILDDALATFYFYPDGSGTGGHIEISAGELAIFVNIDWLTGKIKVEDAE